MDYSVKNTSNGPRYVVRLRSELIAFHRIPGRHTGEHLATVFMNILDRYKIKKVCGSPPDWYLTNLLQRLVGSLSTMQATMIQWSHPLSRN